jgi:hypothetical protein
MDCRCHFSSAQRAHVPWTHWWDWLSRRESTVRDSTSFRCLGRASIPRDPRGDVDHARGAGPCCRRAANATPNPAETASSATPATAAEAETVSAHGATAAGRTPGLSEPDSTRPALTRPRVRTHSAPGRPTSADSTGRAGSTRKLRGRRGPDNHVRPVVRLRLDGVGVRRRWPGAEPVARNTNLNKPWARPPEEKAAPTSDGRHGGGGNAASTPMR